MTQAHKALSLPLVRLVRRPAIVQMWSLYEPYIDAALAQSPAGELDSDGMRQKLLDGQAFLIEIGNDERVYGYACCEIEELRDGDALHVMTLAGHDMALWVDDLLDYLKVMAVKLECYAGITLSGREGWRRALKDKGFKPLWTVLRCKL